MPLSIRLTVLSLVMGAAPLLHATTSGYTFVTVTPCRIADTRNANGAFGGPILAGASSRDFVIPNSSCSIPNTAVAYSLNVTVVPTSGLGYLTVWPAGQSRPTVSTLNSDGRVKANAAIVPAGTNGAVSVYPSDETHFILDINGYFVSTGGASGLAFYTLTPCRIADTRNANGSLGGPSLSGGVNRTFPVLSSSCGIPNTAQAYSLNFTAVPRTGLGYLATWPTGQAKPVVSTLNSNTGTVTANAAIVPAGTSGSVDVFASNDSDVVIDINGYFAPAATGGLALYTMTPCRVQDTRTNGVALNGTFTIAVSSTTCGSTAASGQAFVLNTTVVPQQGLGYLSMWADQASQPFVSTLNANDAAITSNMAIVPTTNGSIDVHTSNPTHLILDISSYFAP